MEKKGMSVYFIHSSKMDFNNDIYLPVLRSNKLSKCNLIFPETEKNKNTYYKDLMDHADVFVVELTSPDTGFNMELKNAILSKKPILALAKQSIGYDERYQKLINNITSYDSGEELAKYVESFVDDSKTKISNNNGDSLILGVLN